MPNAFPKATDVLLVLIYISLKHANGPTEIPELLAKRAISETREHVLDGGICRARKECSKPGVNEAQPPKPAVSCVTQSTSSHPLPRLPSEGNTDH